MKPKIFWTLAVLCGGQLVIPSFAQKPQVGLRSTPPGVAMATPPPAPPATAAERPAKPAESDRYVWVPGHYRPEEGQWKWFAGSWHLPPTDISVWIESTYDEGNKLWFKGYWQPDAPSHGPAPVDAKK